MCVYTFICRLSIVRTFLHNITFCMSFENKENKMKLCTPLNVFLATRIGFFIIGNMVKNKICLNIIAKLMQFFFYIQNENVSLTKYLLVVLYIHYSLHLNPELS